MSPNVSQVKVETPPEKGVLKGSNVPLTSTEKVLTSTENNYEGGSSYSKSDGFTSTEITSNSRSPDNLSPEISPTPPDIVDELCTKCAREVEGLRGVTAAQKEYIDTLEKQSAASKKVTDIQNGIIAQHEKNEADQVKIIEGKDKIIANKDTEIQKLQSEVQTLKAKKCGFTCKVMMVLTGVGIGAILL